MGPALALAEPEKDPRPNFLFLLTDDQRWDSLGVMGNPVIRTPNFDALAKKGVLFRNARVTTSICCVSRASILSGQYQSRHGIDDFSKGFSAEALARTFPALLKSAGYQVGFVGKFGIGSKPPEGFDLMEVGTDDRYWHPDGKGGVIHQTDLTGNQAEAALNRFSGKDEPFCLAVGFKAPHELDGDPPLYPVQERFAKLYEDATIPVPETADPKYWNRYPDFFRTEENLGRKRWRGLLGTPELFQSNVKNYYRQVTGVDDVAGRLFAKLEQLHLAEKTVVILMSDNGFTLGEHGMEGKWFGHEESIRIPLIVYDPQRPVEKQGMSSEIMALNIDLAPTILRLAGLKIPEAMQGIDLLERVDGRRKDRPDFFYEHTYLGSPGLPKGEGVVAPELKYMKFIEHGYEQLYDLKNDPHETTNLAGDPAHQDDLKRMRGRYAALKQEVR